MIMAEFIDHILSTHLKNCTRGAPMGRNFGSPQVGELCHVQQVTLDKGGYDLSGAYWGGNAVGERLYCAFNTKRGDHGSGMSWQQYVRAPDRATALKKFTDTYGVKPFKWSR